MIPIPVIMGALFVGSIVLSAASDFLNGEASEKEREKHRDLTRDIEKEQERQAREAERFRRKVEALAKSYEKEGISQDVAMRKARAELRQRVEWRTSKDIRKAHFRHLILSAQERKETFIKQIEKFQEEKSNLYAIRRDSRGEITQLRSHAITKMLYEFNEALAKMNAYVNYLSRYERKIEQAEAMMAAPFNFELTLPKDYPYVGKLLYMSREDILNNTKLNSDLLSYTLDISEDDYERVLDYEKNQIVPLCLTGVKQRGKTWTASVGYGYFKEHLENAQFSGLNVHVLKNTRYESIVSYHGIELTLPNYELIQPLGGRPQPKMELIVYPLEVDYNFFKNNKLTRVTEQFVRSLNLLQLDEIALAIPDTESSVAFIKELSKRDGTFSSREWKIAPDTDTLYYRMQLSTDVGLLVELVIDDDQMPRYFRFLRELSEEEIIRAEEVFVVSEFTFHIRDESEWEHLIETNPLLTESTVHLKLYLESEFRKQRVIQKAVATRLYYNKWTDLMERLSFSIGRKGPFIEQVELIDQTFDSFIRREKVNLRFSHSPSLREFLDSPDALFRQRQYMMMDHPRYGERVVTIREEDMFVLLEPGEIMLKSDLDNFPLYYVGRSYAEQQQFQAIRGFRQGNVASSVLHELMLDPSHIPPIEPIRLERSDYYNPYIASNPRQREIVETALGAESFYMIQGPPGSGKTTVIQEIVRQHLKLNPHDRILITSQSNVAVDNVMVDFIDHYPSSLVRCGSEEKMQRELISYSFEEVERSYRQRIADKIVPENLDPLLLEWREELEKEDSATIATLILQSKQIVGATCVGLAKRRIGIDRLQFDLVIVDEAGRALPGELLLPVIRARKAILIGDHLQLPPTMPALLTDKDGLLAMEEPHIKDELIEKSLFERLYLQTPFHAKHRLGTQYRMPTSLGRLISTLFYENDLLSGKSTVHKKPIHFPHEMTWLDLGNDRSYFENEKPLSNEREATVIKSILEKIVLTGSDTIGVITPYRAQKRLITKTVRSSSRLNALLNEGRIKIDTVDRFQGEEAEIILYCTTRSKKKTKFFSDAARLNVALSRTKRELLIVGSHRYFKRYDTENPARRIAEYIEKEGIIVSLPQLNTHLDHIYKDYNNSADLVVKTEKLGL